MNEQLADRGVTITTTYGAVLSDLDGGHRQGDTYSGNLNVQASLDGHRSFGASGSTFFVDLLWIHGGQPSAILGDAQGVSNLSAPSKVTLDEAWLQHNRSIPQLNGESRAVFISTTHRVAEAPRNFLDFFSVSATEK